MTKRLPALSRITILFPLLITGALLATGAAAAAPEPDIEIHSAILIHEKRGGPNNLLVIRTTGGHSAYGDRVGAWNNHAQARAKEEASPDTLSCWVISPRSSHGEGRPLLRSLRDSLRNRGAARLWGVFQPGGTDVGNVARFKLTGYREPAPAEY
jgi:hypothetical protein